MIVAIIVKCQVFTLTDTGVVPWTGNDQNSFMTLTLAEPLYYDGISTLSLSNHFFASESRGRGRGSDIRKKNTHRTLSSFHTQQFKFLLVLFLYPVASDSLLRL